MGGNHYPTFAGFDLSELGALARYPRQDRPTVLPASENNSHEADESSNEGDCSDQPQ
jgi:hypothetical protein